MVEKIVCANAKRSEMGTKRCGNRPRSAARPAEAHANVGKGPLLVVPAFAFESAQKCCLSIYNTMQAVPEMPPARGMRGTLGTLVIRLTSHSSICF